MPNEGRFLNPSDLSPDPSYGGANILAWLREQVARALQTGGGGAGPAGWNLGATTPRGPVVAPPAPRVAGVSAVRPTMDTPSPLASNVLPPVRVDPNLPKFITPPTKTDPGPARTSLQFAWGGGTPQNYVPGQTDIDPGGGIEEFMGAQGVSGAHGTGGFSPSQTDWGKVANPMAFEAFRERPAMAEMERDIADPLWREKGAADIQAGAGIRVMERQSELAQAAQEAQMRAAADAAKRAAVAALYADPNFQKAPPDVQARIRAQAETEAENGVRNPSSSSGYRTTYNLMPTMPGRR